jgi:hypothetical protein
MSYVKIMLLVYVSGVIFTFGLMVFANRKYGAKSFFATSGGEFSLSLASWVGIILLFNILLSRPSFKKIIDWIEGK